MPSSTRTLSDSAVHSRKCEVLVNKPSHVRDSRVSELLLEESGAVTHAVASAKHTK